MENTLYAIGKERHFERLPNFYAGHEKFSHLDTFGKVFDFLSKENDDFEFDAGCTHRLCSALSEINRLKDREWLFPRFVAYWNNELARGSYLCEIIEGVSFEWDIEHFLRVIYYRIG